MQLTAPVAPAALFSTLAVSTTTLITSNKQTPSETTKTVAVHKTVTETVPTNPGWQPIQSTNSSSFGQKAKREPLAGPANIQLTVPTTSSSHAPTSAKPSYSTKHSSALSLASTKTITTTSTATATVYAACLDKANYMANKTNPGEYSITSGDCGCEAYSYFDQQPAGSAFACCNICQAAGDCVGSYYDPTASGGECALAHSGGGCGSSQDYNSGE
ncbi:MAG: hypothetical protein LQ340_000440 [Diploschistes diacapsis]|nr:MAG: hypothetical protein LQ340_000440 [Diploschistes diacapsis]